MTSTLSRTQLDELRRKLEEERHRILRVLADTEPRAAQPDQESEIEEAAQRETEEDEVAGVGTRERALLADVDRALGKIASGRYGVSETTGEPIPYERLAAVPWAREPIDE